MFMLTSNIMRLRTVISFAFFNFDIFWQTKVHEKKIILNIFNEYNKITNN